MQTLLKRIETVKSKDDSLVVYLLNHNTANGLRYDTKICGLNMSCWVKKALKGVPFIEFEYCGEDIIEFLKGRLINSRHIVVLSSLTPLMTNPTILKILEYVMVKDINACKFSGGCAFKTEYLKSSKKIEFDSILPLNEEDGLVVNSKSLSFASKILQDRIIQKHISNGVEILGNSVIDETVEIEKACMIFGNNVLKGNTYIGENVILKENNVVEDSSIGRDSCISCSNIVNSKIEENVFILPYCFVKNSTIRKNCYISANNSIENRTIRKGTKLQKENKW